MKKNPSSVMVCFHAVKLLDVVNSRETMSLSLLPFKTFSWKIHKSSVKIGLCACFLFILIIFAKEFLKLQAFTATLFQKFTFPSHCFFERTTCSLIFFSFSLQNHIKQIITINLYRKKCAFSDTKK